MEQRWHLNQLIPVLCMGFLDHLVYQPKSLFNCALSVIIGIGVIIIGIIIICAPPSTGLDIETSYLVHICTYVPYKCTENIQWFCIVVFKWQPFWFFFICYPAHIGSHRDFISHILKYIIITYKHKRYNATTITYLLKFMSIFKKIHLPLTSLRHHVL